LQLRLGAWLLPAGPTLRCLHIMVGGEAELVVPATAPLACLTALRGLSLEAEEGGSLLLDASCSLPCNSLAWLHLNPGVEGSAALPQVMPGPCQVVVLPGLHGSHNACSVGMGCECMRQGVWLAVLELTDLPK